MSNRGPEAIGRIFQRSLDPTVQRLISEVNDKYLHWDKFRFYPLPEGLDVIEAWGAVKISRGHRQTMPLTFSEDRKLTYILTPQHQEWLQLIDKDAGWGGAILKRSPRDEHRRYLTNSLMEEAIASSQLEGAVTTRRRAKELLRSKRKPKTDAERMVVNNYKAILEIRELKDEQLTPALLCHLQKILTDKMMHDPTASGRFRTAAEHIVVADTASNEELYVPPPATVLAQRVAEICDFANTKTRPFVHPVIKAVALHFALGFVHPFVDGNGRTARAIFYWYLLKQGYASFEFLPVSRIFLGGPSRYARAYLYTETDEGDLTYFNHYNLRSIITAIADLHRYLEAQAALLREAMELTETHPELNFRQSELVKQVIHHPGEVIDTQTYAGKYRVSFPTARADLLGLEQVGLLVSFKRGRKSYFKPAGNLIPQLKAVERARRELYPDKSSRKKIRVQTINRGESDEPRPPSRDEP